jgi:ribosomal protein S18 acetylase RimI-like enzyme
VGEIVRLDESDAEEVHELLRVAWMDTYKGILTEQIITAASTVWHSADTLRRQMKNKDVVFAGYMEEGRLLGMARAARTDGETVQVFQLYVLPSSQRKGIGTLLMDYILALFPDSRKFVLGVAKENGKGIAFYRKYGFKFIGETTLNVGVGEIRELNGSLER